MMNPNAPESRLAIMDVRALVRKYSTEEIIRPADGGNTPERA